MSNLEMSSQTVGVPGVSTEASTTESHPKRKRKKHRISRTLPKAEATSSHLMVPLRSPPTLSNPTASTAAQKLSLPLTQSRPRDDLLVSTSNHSPPTPSKTVHAPGSKTLRWYPSFGELAMPYPHPLKLTFVRRPMTLGPIRTASQRQGLTGKLGRSSPRSSSLRTTTIPLELPPPPPPPPQVIEHIERVLIPYSERRPRWEAVGSGDEDD